MFTYSLPHFNLSSGFYGLPGILRKILSRNFVFNDLFLYFNILVTLLVGSFFRSLLMYASGSHA